MPLPLGVGAPNALQGGGAGGRGIQDAFPSIFAPTSQGGLGYRGGALGTAATLSNATIHDPGFGFQTTPNLFVLPGGTSVAVTTNAQFTATVGGQNDVSIIQPL
jgi:hypothetical protein